MITSHSLNLPSWPCAMVLLAPDLCILPTSPVSLYYYYLLVPDLGVPIIHNKKTFPLPYLNKPIYIFFSHFLLRALCLAHTPQSYLQIPAPLYHCYQVAIPSHSIYIQVFHHLLALPSQYPVIYITALNLKDILKHLPPSMSLSLSLPLLSHPIYILILIPCEYAWHFFAIISILLSPSLSLSLALPSGQATVCFLCSSTPVSVFVPDLYLSCPG